MNKTFLKILVCGAWLLTLISCSSVRDNKVYEVKMLSGETLYAQNRPQLKDGFYHFSDLNQQSYMIRNNFVLYVEPTSFKR